MPGQLSRNPLGSVKGAMRSFPQDGGCLCGDLRYSLGEDPVTLYACHCTDCQRQTGSSFALSMIVRRTALRLVQGQAREFSVKLADGRTKGGFFCNRCVTKLWGDSRIANLAVLDPGTLDDTSWVRPVGHIWTHSAQSWVKFEADVLVYSGAPQEEGVLALVRAWKAGTQPP